MTHTGLVIHDQCGTRITDPRRCPQCGQIWCPRCRAWFRAAVSALLGEEPADG